MQYMIKLKNHPGTRFSFCPFSRTLIHWIFTCLFLGLVFAAFANPAYAQAPIKIMPLGDSITYDDRIGDLRTFGERTGYRQPLWQLMSSSGYYVDFVGTRIAGQDVLPAFDPDNDGYPGWRDDQIAQIIYDLLTQNTPDMVLLHVGTNGVDPSDLDVEFILDEIDRYEADYGAGVTVFLAHIINRSTYDATTTQFNNNVEAMAQLRIAAGDDIVIVDMEDGAGLDYRIEPQGDMADNLHPSADGYVKIANKWMEALSSYLSIPSDFVPPIINTVPSITSAFVGELYAYNLVASGSPLLSYELTESPIGMTIDPTTGRIEWTPTLVGVAAVEVTVSNGANPDAVQVFDLAVEEERITVVISGDALSGAVAQGEWRYYAIDTTADDTELVVELTNLSSDVDLYVRNGAEPTLSTYDCRPYEGQTTSETCTLPNTGATTWYIGVHGYTAANFTINATRVGTTALFSDESQSGSLGRGEWDYYVVDTTATDTQVVVEMTNLSADLDLYVLQGSKPTTSLYDCRSNLGQTNAEICTLPNTGATIWYVGVYGYRAGSYTIQATLVSDSTNLPPVLTSIGTQSVQEGQQLVIPINASDPDGPAPLVLSANNAPASAIFVDNGDGTGQFTWTPVIGEVSGSPYSVTFAATDDGGAGLSNSEIVTINVTPAGGGGSTVVLNSGDALSGAVAQGEWRYYAIDTTADDTELVVELTNLSSDVDLYVRNGAEPTLSTYDCRPYEGQTTSETCTLPNTGATTWYIGVHGYTAANFTINATRVGTTALFSDESQSGSLGRGEWDYYVVDTTATDTQVVVEMTNLSADLDLYVLQGSKPTTSLYDCRSNLGQTNAEICTLPNTGATIWYVGVYGYRAGSYTIQATLVSDSTNLPPVLTSIGTQSVQEGQQLVIPINASDPDGPAPLVLSANNAPASAIFVDNGDGTGQFTWTPVIGEVSGSPYSVTFAATDDGGAGLSNSEIVTINVTPAGGGGSTVVLNSGDALSGAVAQGEWRYYAIDTTADDTELVVELTNLSSDVDLYVRNGAEPTLSTYDCRPYEGQTTSETCTLPNTGATTWYIGVHGYTAANFTINATRVGTTALSSGGSQDGSLAQGEWDYYKIDATDANTQIVVEMTNLSADVDLYVLQGSKPTTSLYDCRPYEGQTNSETCTLPNTGATTWYIGVHGFRTGSYTVAATLQ